MSRALARIEIAGIPTFAVTRKGFDALVRSTFQGMGFVSDASQFAFPVDMFLAESDLAPIQENVDKIIAGLTTWKPKTADSRYKVPRIAVDSKDHNGAVHNMNLLFLRNSWGDGLPLLPATEERVTWLLEGTELSPQTLIGAVMPRGGLATVETIAVSLAMAGGRAEYMPLLIAAIEAITDPKWKHQNMTTTTCSVFPAVIVNGPIGEQIRVNSGYGMLGPSAEFPAGASIGRAIRLVLQNIGGAIPGTGTMALFGAMRHTNAVFAEDERGIPSGWLPLNAELGFVQGDNTVTVLPVASTANVLLSNRTDGPTAEEGAYQYLRRIAGFMRTPNQNAYDRPRGSGHASGVVLITRGLARHLAKLGWSKEDVKGFLWENSRLPWTEVKSTGMAGSIVAAGFTEGEAPPISMRPEDVMLVIAGGEQGGHAYWMQVGPEYQVSSKRIRLPGPTKWDRLLKQAETELGAVPAR
ncbi:MAG: hypothetical protein HYX90_11130 [Chloroflexi bacterium]|nr:hypothetical protein [Chloroflexota bacterium]